MNCMVFTDCSLVATPIFLAGFFGNISEKPAPPSTLIDFVCFWKQVVSAGFDKAGRTAFFKSTFCRDADHRILLSWVYTYNRCRFRIYVYDSILRFLWCKQFWLSFCDESCGCVLPPRWQSVDWKGCWKEQQERWGWMQASGKRKVIYVFCGS